MHSPTPYCYCYHAILSSCRISLLTVSYLPKSQQITANTYTTGATAPRRALRQQPGVVSTRSRCNTLSLGSKLIISSLHTGPSCQPPRSRICLHQCNQSIKLQSIRGFEPINQSIQSKGFKISNQSS